VRTEQYPTPLVVPKVWGEERVLANGPYCAKLLRIDAGASGSLHRHLVKDETFILVTGTAYVVVMAQGEAVRVEELTVPGQCVHVRHGVWHRLGSSGGGLVAEASTEHRDEDVERATPSRPGGDRGEAPR